jgi:tRNA A37 methylthiotransferase MiaB
VQISAAHEVEDLDICIAAFTKVGKELDVLAESWETGILSGRGEGNQLIHFAGDAAGVGRFHRVRVTEAQTWALKGESCPVH